MMLDNSPEPPPFPKEVAASMQPARFQKQKKKAEEHCSPAAVIETAAVFRPAGR